MYMFLIPWVSQLPRQSRRFIQRLFYADVSVRHPSLAALDARPDQLPDWVRDAPVAMRYLQFLGPLAWQHVPTRSCATPPQAPPLPYSPFLAACLVKVDQQIGSMARLWQYLVDHPALTWLLGFPLVPSPSAPWGFDVQASLPTPRHFTRMLRTLPNPILQGLLDSTVSQLKATLPSNVAFGEAISLDTKHILAWVIENNPNAYVDSPTGRYDPARQPIGDPDCRLGCKTRRNQQTTALTLPTPLTDPVPASTVKVGTWYWGYGTGVVATKVPGWGEFVLAECTQPFNCADVTYFFPLMQATTRRLGVHPRYGAFDAAFDAWYVYADFHNEEHDGFAAVPFVAKGGKAPKSFNDDGLPRCQAGLSMPLWSTFWAKTSAVPHEKGRYGCPLAGGHDPSAACPIRHATWEKGGCTTTIPTSVGARLRSQLDRESPAYKDVYRQRTATERVNSQAVNLGIERPRLRNGKAIANHNTLIYIVINLRALQRVQQKKGEDPSPSETELRQS
jgi:hypothetical protein